MTWLTLRRQSSYMATARLRQTPVRLQPSDIEFDVHIADGFCLQ